MIFPFLSSAGGNCQDTVILVEELAITVKPLGGPDGTAIEQLILVKITFYEQIDVTCRINLIELQVGCNVLLAKMENRKCSIAHKFDVPVKTEKTVEKRQLRTVP